MGFVQSNKQSLKSYCCTASPLTYEKTCLEVLRCAIRTCRVLKILFQDSVRWTHWPWSTKSGLYNQAQCKPSIIMAWFMMPLNVSCVVDVMSWYTSNALQCPLTWKRDTAISKASSLSSAACGLELNAPNMKDQLEAPNTWIENNLVFQIIPKACQYSRMYLFMFIRSCWKLKLHLNFEAITARRCAQAHPKQLLAPRSEGVQMIW